MSTIFGIPAPALYGQLLIGLINGSFYAMLSLGLAVIFGLLRVINFAHGAQYMLGAFAAYLLLDLCRHRLLARPDPRAPASSASSAIVIERVMLSRLYGVDPLYGLLLTFGLALIIEGAFRYWFGAAGKPYAAPAAAHRRASISASCSCRSTAAGWSSPRWSSASAPGS